jgi:hypothetical protein
MELDDFDAEDTVEQEQVPDRLATEIQQTERMQRWRSTRDLVLTPEVATAIRDGWSYQEIADVLGISYQSVLKHAKSAEMQDLVDREARRVLRHLSNRSLKEEKYRDLAVSLGVLVDKGRILAEKPTQIIRTDEGTVDRLENLLFGQAVRRTQSYTDVTSVEVEGSRGIPQLSDGTEQTGPQESPTNPDGSDEPGSERKS